MAFPLIVVPVAALIVLQPLRQVIGLCGPGDRVKYVDDARPSPKPQGNQLFNMTLVAGMDNEKNQERYRIA